MDTADSQHLSRISKMLLAGTGLAFAWVLLSFTLGLAASQAHADEDGLLGGVASIVDGGATAATGVVGDTGTAVVETVAPIAEPVVSAAEPVAAVVEPVASTVQPVVDTGQPVVDTVVEPVVNTVQPVVNTVQPVVKTVVEPVAGVVAPVVTAGPLAPVAGVVGTVVSTVGELPPGGVVSPIVDTALGVVDAVPVVGGVVSGLGVDTAATSVGSSVDGVLQGGTATVLDTVSGIVSPVGGLIDPVAGVIANPAVPALSGLQGAGAAAPAVGVAGTDGGPLEMLARAAYLAGTTAWLTITSALPPALSSTDSVFVSGSAVGGVLSLLRSVLQADSVLIGPGGAGPGAWVLVALGFVVAYRAWVRRSGLENDVAPAAPVLSTDVSPD